MVDGESFVACPADRIRAGLQVKHNTQPKSVFIAVDTRICFLNIHIFWANILKMIRIQFYAYSGHCSDPFPIPPAVVLSVNASFDTIRGSSVKKELSKINPFQFVHQTSIALWN